MTGGSLTCAASRTLTGSGATDAGGSGLAHYQHRIPADNGVTWDIAVTGSSLTLAATGTYLIQFRAVDGAGNIVGLGTGLARPRGHRLHQLTVPA